MAAIYQKEAMQKWKNILAARDFCSCNMVVTVLWTYAGLLIRKGAKCVIPAVRILEENTE